MNRSTEHLFEDESEAFLVGRDVYRDPEVFEWEMKYLFEGTWNLVGLSSQVPNPHDYVTGFVGRAPIIVTRGADGRLHCLLNTCRHKGAQVCHRAAGNARTFQCRYHGWSYDSAGRNILIKDRDQGAYSSRFDEDDHDLVPVARFDEYRGLLFASLSADVPPLADWLGDVRRFIDLVVDQSPHGVECVPGRVDFVFHGNWKLQLENGVDPYHFSSTHPSYIQALQQRRSKASVYADFRSSELERGTFAFANGHNAMWGPAPSEKSTPLDFIRDELVARVGPTTARWMSYVRNVTLFPNAQFAENASLQLRIWRPVAVDRTEMRTWCLAPVGEPAAARRLRIRQYEEFFNPSGLATPDDLANYEDCQRGFAAHAVRWQQGHARGAAARSTAESHPSCDELGVRPVSVVVGPFDLGDETIMQPTYRCWRELVERGLARDAAASSAK
jgi:phenylpropionate dioxygenase-like ring-hydroxylating dioxygenase large terminal subunit